jgi:hypothetical protein
MPSYNPAQVKLTPTRRHRGFNIQVFNRPRLRNLILGLSHRDRSMRRYAGRHFRDWRFAALLRPL